VEIFKEFLKTLFDLGMCLNILVILPQPIKIWRLKSAENVSAWTWFFFFIFQTATSLHGVLNLHSTAMFLGMGGSALISLITLILCLVYKSNK